MCLPVVQSILHLTTSESGPVQSSPPQVEVHVLNLRLFPSPHVAEHGSNSDHCDQLPSTMLDTDQQLKYHVVIKTYHKRNM